MHGVIERVIENWLTSANERTYQIPFCQLLAAEGETIIYISPHGPFEQGKDVITIDPQGKTRAYQLKNGDFGLAEWRKHHGELTDLVELPIAHPGIRNKGHHMPFLVTNGELKDTAIKAITAANTAWRRRRYPALRTISKGELLRRFVKASGAYLPRELAEFTAFLELVIRDGREPLEKEKFARVWESILGLATSRRAGTTDVGRAVASGVLVTAYVLQRSYESENHWAIFEGWIVAASSILAIATKARAPEKAWLRSFEFCELGAVTALEGLRGECARREHLVEGDPMTDGHVYGTRVTVVLGLLSALHMYGRLKGNAPGADERDGLRRLLDQYGSSMKVLGESVIPYFVLAALGWEAVGQQLRGEGLLVRAAEALLGMAGPAGTIFPSPYYAPNQVIRLFCGLDDPPREDFLGISYTARPVVDCLVRRWRRQAVRSLWYGMTGTSLKAFVPSEAWEWCRWRATTGALTSALVNSPQSWTDLCREVAGIDTSILPQQLARRPWFLVLFLLVYPQRFTRVTMKVVDELLADA